MLAGLLFLFWLLPFAGEHQALFGLGGWFDATAYREASHLRGLPPHLFGWSLVYLCGTNSVALAVVYWLLIASILLFTLGLATRITGILTWVAVVSYTANPALAYDADPLLNMLAFYLMIGYLLLGQRRPGQLWLTRLLGPRETWLFRRAAENPTESVGANLAMRLFQVHFAIAMVASGLHKLQIKEWWNGLAPWFYVNAPYHTTEEQVKSFGPQAGAFLTLFSLFAYLTLAWQIGFPGFAWRRGSWRVVSLGGAGLAWLACTFWVPLPLFGPLIFVACLGYLSPDEWHRWPRSHDPAARSAGAAEPPVQCAGRISPDRSEGWNGRSGNRCLRGATLMKTRYLIALLMGTAALVAGINCAPVDPPESGDTRAIESGQRVPDRPPQGAAVPPFQPMPTPLMPTAAPSDAIKQRIDLAIAQVRARQLRTDNGFWTVFHGILGLGPSVTLEDPLTGRKVNALDYIAAGGKVPGLHFVPTGDGLDVETGPGTFEKQGHQDQFIAEMVEWNVAPERKFKVEGKDHTFGDFLRLQQGEGQPPRWGKNWSGLSSLSGRATAPTQSGPTPSARNCALKTWCGRNWTRTPTRRPAAGRTCFSG